MVLWGGLRPIVSQNVVDFITLITFGNAVVSTQPSRISWSLMGFGAGLAIAVSGTLTNRWTVIFPMFPLIVLQSLRLIFKNKNKWISNIIFGLSLFLITISAALSILFPAVELPSIDTFGAEYNVGIVDLYLPIDLMFTSPIPNTQQYCPTEQDHATIRILYPTLEEPEDTPYLRPHTSEVYCEENMKHSAPPPLAKHKFLIHNWRLIRMQAKHHAQPAVGGFNQGLLPVVFFSHGLGGSAEMYSYQTHALAAHGFVVVVIDHTDGSAPVVSRKDGTLLRRNETVLQQWLEGKKDEYRSSRRAMTAYRAAELLAVVDSFLRLNDENLSELEAVGLDFRGKLDRNDIHYMGHSFGGATSIHAAVQRPPKSLLVHDPASDWIPRESQRKLFDIERIGTDSRANHTYWTSDHDNSDNNQIIEDEDQQVSVSLHDNTHMLILFSDEWFSRSWAGADVLNEMHDRNALGPKGGVSRVGVIDQAFHQEFSDACMLTPLWIARGVGLTGPRNPIETAKDIHVETVSFLKSLRDST
jgi:platelet-activating factor acetylhydrolase